jgi:hypothetical protein
MGARVFPGGPGGVGQRQLTKAMAIAALTPEEVFPRWPKISFPLLRLAA